MLELELEPSDILFIVVVVCFLDIVVVICFVDVVDVPTAPSQSTVSVTSVPEESERLFLFPLR